MLWPAVADSYLRTFERARTEHAQRLHTAFRASTLATRPAELPQVNTTLLLCRVEDRTGRSHLCAARSADGVGG